jgi:hypothetical protein
MKEVCSPANSGHTGPGKIGGGQPLSPGARSNPSSGNRRDSVPDQPSGRQVSRGSNKDPEPSLEVE